MMDKRQEITGAEAFRLIFESRSLMLRTTVIAQVVKWNGSERNTVDVQPVLETLLDGEEKTRKLPVVNDVPVKFYGSGDLWIVFEPKVGSYCELQISDRCIEGWKKTGGILDPKLGRHHDLSDATAYFGLNPFPDAIPGVEPDTMHIRTRDGATGVRVKADSVECYTGDSSHLIEAAKISNTVGGVLVSEATSGLVDFKVPIQAPTSTVTGVSTTNSLVVTTSTQTATLNATTGASIGGKNFATHTHGGVQTGGGNTGGVN